MPYHSNDELPANVKSVLPREALDLWRAAYNDNFPDDARASAAAWKKVRDAGFANLPGQAGWSRMESMEAVRIWRELELTPIPPMQGWKYNPASNQGADAVRVPHRWIPNVAGKIIHATAAMSRRSYQDGVRVAMQDNEFLASLYIAGPERGLSYWLIGPGAREALEILVNGGE